MAAGREEHDNDDPPAMQNPPEDWPLEKRIASHEKWVKAQGGAAYTSPDAPPGVLHEFLSYECPICAGKPPKKLRDFFEPPLDFPDPNEVPDDLVEDVLAKYTALLAERNFSVEECKHMTPRDVLVELAETMDEEYHEMGEGTWHLTFGENCEECMKEWELEERTFDWNDRVREEISEARGVLVDLEEFFREADEEIAGDPNDPRDGLGRLPGLGRLVILAHCVLDRLEEDIKRGLVSLPMGMEEGAENGHRYLEALGAMQRTFKAVLVWYDRDDVDWAVRLTSAALESAGKFREKDRARSGGRLFRDLVRVSPDFRILLGLFQDIQENRSTRPEHPEADESWSVDRWLQYYRERCRLEEPMIAVVDAEGFTRESLAKGMKIMEEESERLDRRGEEFLERHRLMKNRDAAFDPDRPGVFLELPEIPDVEDDEEHDVEPIDVGDGNDEPPSSWASSIPEIAAWESDRGKRSLESTGTERRHDFRSDPVYQLLRSFSLALFSLLRQEAPGPASGEGPEKTPRRSPLDHYLTLLVLKAQARISSSRVFADSVGHPAPRQGAILFATECLGKIAEAAEKFAPTHLRSLSGQARDTQRQLEELLDGE